jgi:hypothetical protein
MATPPTSQIDRDTQDGVVDDQPQAARSQLMGRERCRLGATGARSSVTRTIDTPPAHGPVVRVNFVYSRRLRKFDITDLSFWGGPRIAWSKTDLVPPFFMRHLLRAKTKKEAGF